MAEQLDAAGLDELLAECEQLLDYRFGDRRFLQHSLTHASAAVTRLESNERLEFLGDAIMGAVVCEMLYERFPGEPEGELTRIKSALVSRTTCAEISDELELDRFLLLGKGLIGHASLPMSVMAAVFEAVVAAVYLDGGFEAARSLVRRFMGDRVDGTSGESDSRNYKSLLQQMAQRTFGRTPTYRTLDVQGPDHSKCFQIAATIGPHVYPAAWGASKKEAEQLAAKNALFELSGEELPHATD